ncbi:MAG: GDP-mannose 4,6-dehydratase [Myxococcota bacterium]
MSRRVLVTGAEGFVGAWLLPALESRGDTTVASYRPDRAAGAPAPRRQWRACDVRNSSAVAQLLRSARPDAILHLAALASPPEAQADPLAALATNTLAVDSLARAILRWAPGARLLYVSTGEVYGARPLGAAPARECDPLRPESFYASTKAAAECRLLLAAKAEGLDVVVARPLNHSGPGRPDRYVESSFARQIAVIESGRREPTILVGNLEPVRDFSDVRDVVSAYLLLLEDGAPGEVYNVCSGRGRTVREVLDYLVARARREVRVQIDPERFRPAPPERLSLVGDPGRLRALGWRARHRFEDTLETLLDSWRARLA